MSGFGSSAPASSPKVALHMQSTCIFLYDVEAWPSQICLSHTTILYHAGISKRHEGVEQAAEGGAGQQQSQTYIDSRLAPHE